MNNTLDAHIGRAEYALTAIFDGGFMTARGASEEAEQLASDAERFGLQYASELWRAFASAFDLYRATAGKPAPTPEFAMVQVYYETLGRALGKQLIFTPKA